MIQGLGDGRWEMGTPPAGERTRLKETVEQFEALLIADMMRAMKASGSSGWLGEEDAAADSALGLAEEHFSRALAARGGLGLADMVMRGLAAEEGRSKGEPAGRVRL